MARGRDHGTTGRRFGLGRRSSSTRQTLIRSAANSWRRLKPMLTTARYLSSPKKKDRDLSTLSKCFQEVQARDYFAAELGRQTLDKLLASGGPS